MSALSLHIESTDSMIRVCYVTRVVHKKPVLQYYAYTYATCWG